MSNSQGRKLYSGYCLGGTGGTACEVMSRGNASRVSHVSPGQGQEERASLH